MRAFVYEGHGQQSMRRRMLLQTSMMVSSPQTERSWSQEPLQHMHGRLRLPNLCGRRAPPAQKR